MQTQPPYIVRERPFKLRATMLRLCALRSRVR